MIPRYVIIADPGSMRYEYFTRELQASWNEHGTVSNVHVIDWNEVCALQGHIDELLPQQPAVLRIESPARDFEVIRELLKAGQCALGERPSSWDEGGHGWIASPRYVFRGLEACLGGISAALERNPQIVSPARPSDIVTLFDKNRTSALLEQAGLPVPRWFAPERSVDDLLSELRQRRWPDAFVKLAFGSCASGIVAVESGADSLSGVTTVKEVDGRFCNTFDVRRVTETELYRILEFILSEDATVQQTVPKTTLAGQNFDLRMVVLNRQVVASICRVSSHPMTNLHLGGWRGSLDACRRVIGPRHWLDAVDCCEEVAGLFELPCVGVDVAFDRTTGKPFILEVNAFGDFFPNWVDEAGRSIHRLEIEQAMSLCQA